MVNLQKLSAIVTALDAGNLDGAKALAHAKRESSTGWTTSAGSVLSTPTNDSFYSILDSSEIEDYSLGSVIKSRPVGGFSDNQNVTAYQVVYRSENSHGNAVGALTTILIPSNNDQKHVVVYPQYEDSSWIDCSSSYELLANGLGPQINSFLSAGYVVNIPDHEGFNSSFVAGPLEGKLTLDSIRALEASRNLTQIENDEYVVIGYSGGSIAAGWAAELQSSYAPDLDIKGFSMGGFVADPRAVWLTVNKGPYVGFLPAAVLGIASEYTELWDLFETEFVQNKSSVFLDALTQCVSDDLIEYYKQDMFDYFTKGEGFLDVPQVKSTLENVKLGKTVPKAPMFIYNGVVDDIAPIKSVDDIVQYYCDGGAAVLYNRGAGKDHTSMAQAAAVELNNWVDQAFAGNLSNVCQFEGVSPSYANSSNSTGAGSNSTSAGSNSTTGGTHSAGANSSSTGSDAAANSGSKNLPGLLAVVIGLGFMVL